MYMAIILVMLTKIFNIQYEFSILFIIGQVFIGFFKSYNIFEKAMKFSSVDELLHGLENKEILTHQIKGKRLRKQLKGLNEMQPTDFAFEAFEILPAAIAIYIKVPVQEKSVDLALRIDFEYPFNQPQIYLINNENSEYRFCKDLLPSILNGKIWGPSLTLPLFLEKIPELATNLTKKEKLQWCYHKGFQYCREQLLKNGVKLFEAEEYKWDFKVIKNTRKKVIGLAPDSFLLFEELENDSLKLQIWETISNLKEVKATMGKNKYSLEIQSPENGKIYLGGNSKDIDEILGVLNPIQMIQRKLQNSQKAGGALGNEEIIRMYSTLIEHYSLVDKVKMEKYVTQMKKIINEQFHQEQEYGKEQKMVEIQT